MLSRYRGSRSDPVHCGSRQVFRLGLHTFVNQLVGLLTPGIYTPMQIRVTCAAPNSASANPAFRVVASGTSAVAREEALAIAVRQAATTKKSVYLEF